jgi:hypothetical protein
MLRLRLGIAALLTVASPWLCRADQTFTFLDSTEAPQVSYNGTLLACGSAVLETCSIFISPGGVLPEVDLSFNIFDPDGVTFSDQFHIYSDAESAVIRSTFQSVTDGTVLALPGGTKMIEDGTVQTVATIPTGTLGDLIFQFQSGVSEGPEPATVTEGPEPATVTLLGIGALGLLSGRRRWLRRGRTPSGADRLG